MNSNTTKEIKLKETELAELSELSFAGAEHSPLGVTPKVRLILKESRNNSMLTNNN